ncbi:hypothetical protein [Nocardia sp. NPDC057030]|uniref:hypothetical protein n=1 Tax=unclassified Nocardia TaxID=2637762 RepID=UPI00363BA1DC
MNEWQQLGPELADLLGKRLTAVARELADEVTGFGYTNRRVAATSKRVDSGFSPGSPGSIFEPLHSSVEADGFRYHPRRRNHTKQAFNDRLDDLREQKATDVELALTDKGCIGVLMRILGRSSYKDFEHDLYFTDVEAQKHIAVLNLMFAAPEMATGAVVLRLRKLNRARDELGALHGNPVKDVGRKAVELRVREAKIRIDHHSRMLEGEIAAARREWARTTPSQWRNLRTMRWLIRMNGHHRLLMKGARLIDKFNFMLETSSSPAQFFSRVGKDSELASIAGVRKALAGKDHTTITATGYIKHFHSGQQALRNADGEPLMHPDTHRRAGTPYVRTTAPDYRNFAANSFGQVDMTNDGHAKMGGFVNFDYGWYQIPGDRLASVYDAPYMFGQFGDVLHANHADYNSWLRRQDPMVVYQSSLDRFARGVWGQDQFVLGIAFV